MNAWRTIRSDYLAAKRNDPSISDGARGFFEVLLCTPGFFAITAHRGIHFLHSTLHIPVLPRVGAHAEEVVAAHRCEQVFGQKFIPVEGREHHDRAVQAARVRP